MSNSNSNVPKVNLAKIFAEKKLRNERKKQIWNNMAAGKLKPLNINQAMYAADFLGFDAFRCKAKSNSNPNPYTTKQLLDMAMKKAKKWNHSTTPLKKYTREKLCKYLRSDTQPKDSKKSSPKKSPPKKPTPKKSPPKKSPPKKSPPKKPSQSSNSRKVRYSIEGNYLVIKIHKSEISKFF